MNCYSSCGRFLVKLLIFEIHVGHRRRRIRSIIDPDITNALAVDTTAGKPLAHRTAVHHARTTEGPSCFSSTQPQQ
ncbi:hypothetical protein V6N13_099840 [Hibiscus sabdariffa]